MTPNNTEGLWALILGRYAGNLHIIRNADRGEAPSLVRNAEMENTVIKSFALDHFGLAEALQKLDEFVRATADFPP